MKTRRWPVAPLSMLALCSAQTALAAPQTRSHPSAVPATQATPAALSNDAFAAEVKRLRGQMLQQDTVVADAANLCAYLPRHRADEEPRCVALRGHLQARAARAAEPSAQAAGKRLLPEIARCLAAVVQGAA